MRIDKILQLAFIGTIVLAFIVMANASIDVGILLLIIAISLGFIALRVSVNFLLRHDIIQLSKTHSTTEILRTVEKVLVESKWSGAVGPGHINMRQSKLLGIVSGPVLSVSLSERYDNTYELDLWVSDYERSSKGVPKIGDAYPKMKDKILEAVAQYV